MDTIQKAVLIGHTLIALLIIVLVLLQRGKGADAGAAFGAGASGTVFGARGSGSFFSRATAVCATAFFVTSLTLAYLSSQNYAAPSSVIDDVPEVEEAIDAVESGMPALETGDAAGDDLADDAADMPALEETVTEEAPADGEQDPQ
jgi:preprotein translocase subunit SecG